MISSIISQAATPEEAAAQIRAIHGDDTRAMVRDLAIALYFTFREKPAATRIRALLGHGSATTINDAMNAFWDFVRDMAYLRVNAPDVPAPLLDKSGDLVAALWRTACAHAKEEFAAEREALVLRRQEDQDTAARSIQAANDAARDAATAQSTAEADARAARDERVKTEERAARAEASLAAASEAIAQGREQIEAAAGRLADQMASYQVLQARMDAQTENFQVERQRDREVIEGLEKRAAQEVDNARQDAKRARDEAQAFRKEAAAEKEALLSRLAALGADLAASREGQVRTLALMDAGIGREGVIAEERDALRVEGVRHLEDLARLHRDLEVAAAEAALYRTLEQMGRVETNKDGKREFVATIALLTGNLRDALVQANTK